VWLLDFGWFALALILLVAGVQFASEYREDQRRWAEHNARWAQDAERRRRAREEARWRAVEAEDERRRRLLED
jgi:hypothetical protein